MKLYEIIDGSFSSVSTATIARVGSFFWHFRGLQDPQSFAPLRSQNFRKKSPDFFAKMKFSFSFSFLQNSMNFVIFLLNFDEFLSEFHEELQKITDILDIFTKLIEKFRNMLEFSRFCEEFHSSVSLFSIDSLVATNLIHPGL